MFPPKELSSDVNERRFVRGALMAWMIFALILATLLIVKPQRSLAPLYADASRQFWSGVIPTAEYRVGFYYLPVSQILYTPIAMAGPKVGGVVAQIISLSLITWAAWELTTLLMTTRRRLAFAMILLLLIPGVAGILRVVQLDAPMWALTAVAAAAIARRRVGLAATLLALAFAIKPTAIVAAMLMGATWPRVGLRLLPLMLFALLVPFLFADWSYVARLYASLADRIHGAIQQRGHWIDIGSLLTVGMGLKVPFGVMLGIRATMAAAALGITLVAREKLERPYAAFLAFAFAALYLLLFNPRTEGGGYAGLSLVAAPFAARMLLAEGKILSAVVLVLVCIAMGITSLTHSTMAFFGSWFKPTVGILVTLFVLVPRAFDARLFLPIARSSESVSAPQPPRH
jgi:alpha-1,2-mannosyltransferase